MPSLPSSREKPWSNGEIAEIGDLKGQGTKETIDAEGQIVYFFEMNEAKSIKCK
ncbi:MAG: hypothetical protein V3T02_08175 [Alphaproteobacteria bacterium]